MRAISSFAFLSNSIEWQHLATPGLHADINGDGIVEHVQVYGKAPDATLLAQHAQHHGLPGCSTLVSAGIPSHQVFNASVCKYVGGASGKAGRFLRREGKALEVATPALIPIAAHRLAARAPLPTPPNTHGRSHGGHAPHSPLHHRRRPHKYDLVFLNSYGEVTCLTSLGHRRWSIQAGSGWTDALSRDAVDSAFPSVRAMELRIGGHNYVIVAAGAWAATVISANGKKLQSIDFPEPPNHELLVMDFNSDGLNDLVVCTGEGFYGFAQVRHFSTVPFTGLLACLIVAMISVYVSIHGGAGGKASRGGARGQAKARAFNKD